MADVASTWLRINEAATAPEDKFPIKALQFVPTLHNDTYPAIDPATKSDLSGRYVLITGASKGIGRATALSFAKAGAKGIAIGARSSLASLETEISEAAKVAGKAVPKVLSIELDVTSRKSVDNAAELVSSSFPHLDILINNAGVGYPWARITEMDPDEWWHTWEVNIHGTFLVTRAFIPLLVKSSSSLKTLIDLSSANAEKAFPGTSAYGTAKLALLRLGEYLNVEYKEEGLLAYTVHPGVSPTEMGLKLPESVHFLLTDTPEVAADTMCWLAQTRREWLAGRYLWCTWDMGELMDRKDEIIKKDLLKVDITFD